MLKEPAAQVVAPPVVQPAHSPTPKKVRKIDRVEVKRVSFSTNDNFGGRKVKGLQFKIRNSLNYSMCKAMTRKEGCERMSAYLGRIMVWFLDIEKNMRNGDVVHLVYEVLDSEDRFKVLKLTYQSGYASKTFEANYYRKSENDYGAYYDKEGKEIAGKNCKLNHSDKKLYGNNFSAWRFSRQPGRAFGDGFQGRRWAPLSTQVLTAGSPGSTGTRV